MRHISSSCAPVCNGNCDYRSTEIKHYCLLSSLGCKIHKYWHRLLSNTQMHVIPLNDIAPTHDDLHSELAGARLGTLAAFIGSVFLSG